MEKIICIGSSAKDIFFPTDEGVLLDTPEDIKAQKKLAFELGAKYHIENRFESLGGCAVNVACGLRKLGIESACYTVIGTDMVGEWIWDQIEKAGVIVEKIVREECLSGLSAIIIDSRSGERIIFSNQEANKRLRINSEVINDFRWISVTDPNGDWKTILNNVVQAASNNGARIAFNPRGKNITEDASAVYAFGGKSELFFVNKDEAIEIITDLREEMMAAEKLNDEKFLLQELKKSGAKVVIITDGKRGAWTLSDGEMIHAESLPEKAIDSTGAGDAFSSGFLAAYMKNKDLGECLSWGIANGGNAVNFYGGVAGLLDEIEIAKKASEVKINK